jgi:ADP-heptose:LPS heptosyltransferase
LNPIARRIASTGIRWIEWLVRPSSLSRAAASRNFLVPQFQAALGTVVHATPVIESLAEAMPQARIVVVGNHFAEQIYGGNPHVSAVLQVPNPLHDLRGAIRAIRSLRPFHGEPYTTLLTTGNERTKITLWAVFAGPSRRIGFAVLPELVHEPLQWDPAGSQVSNNLRLLQVPGLQATAQEPRIYPSPRQIADAEERLVALGSAAGRRRIALVTQTSPTQRKGWRADRWIALTNYFIESEDADLIFVGTAGESGAIDTLRAQIGHATINLAGQTGIAELAAIFTRCDLGVSLDTGPLHVGRAVGLPMVVIAPAWSPVHEWLPVNDSRYRILKNANFAPPAPSDYIIDEVGVDEVIAAAQDLARSSAGKL